MSNFFKPEQYKVGTSTGLNEVRDIYKNMDFINEETDPIKMKGTSININELISMLQTTSILKGISLFNDVIEYFKISNFKLSSVGYDKSGLLVLESDSENAISFNTNSVEKIGSSMIIGNKFITLFLKNNNKINLVF
jgi:hypothetical protein